MQNLDSIETIHKVFNSIFKSDDAFEKMFHENIKGKILLYRTNGCTLNKKQFTALMKTVNTFGESTCYLAVIEGGFLANATDKNDIYDSTPKEISTNISYEDYCKYRLMRNNALFSKQGTWGIIISHEDHAVIGGSVKFIKKFKTFYHDLAKNVKKFIEHWEYCKENYNVDLSWLPEFLNYIDPGKLLHK